MARVAHMQAAPAEAVLRDAEELLTELLAAGEYDYGVRQDGKGVYRFSSSALRARRAPRT
jgi:hypothetical protein